jgi:hypothetical protein
MAVQRSEKVDLTLAELGSHNNMSFVNIAGKVQKYYKKNNFLGNILRHIPI